MPPKPSYPLAQRSQSFRRNHIPGKGSSLNMNPLETKVELMSSGRYERRGSSTTISLLGRKQCLRNSILSVVQTTITKFRCSEHDTEEWHSQAAFTEAFKISRNFPSLSPSLVTQIDTLQIAPAWMLQSDNLARSQHVRVLGSVGQYHLRMILLQGRRWLN